MKMQKPQMTLLALVTLIWILGGAIGLAAEEQERQQFLVIVNEDVKPEAMETYMRARAGQAKLADQYTFEFPYLTFVQDFRVTSCYMFNAFAQLDGFPERMEAWSEKTGGKDKQLQKQVTDCVSDSSTAIVVFRPDLSYTPENPTFTPSVDEPFYSFRVVYHLKPGKLEEAEAVAKRIKVLNEKKQSPMAYLMYDQIFGQNDYSLVAVINVKDKASFAALDKQMQANPDPEIEKLFAQNVHLLKKITTEEGTLVPEATYMPD